MTPELSVKITADIDLLRDNFRKAVADVKGFDKNTKASLSAIDKSFEKLANDVEGSMSKSATSVSKASSSITKSLAQTAAQSAKTGTSIASGSNQAAFALTNLGRVAQDAPYGFIGIQNNLNPLLESFQRLRAETGSNSSALAALGKSLIGPAGIGIALSLVSAGILLYQKYAKDAEDTTDGLARATKEYNKELSENIGNAKSEAIQLQSLVEVARDETVSKEGRLQAIKAINEIMPDYLGDIKLDGINSEETTKKINKYTEALYLNAKVKAASSLIEKEFTKQFEAQNQTLAENATIGQKIGAVIGAAVVGIGEEFKQLNQLNPFALLTVGASGAAKATEVYNTSLNRLGQQTLDTKINESNKSVEFFKNIITSANKELANMGLLFEDTGKKATSNGTKIKTSLNTVGIAPVDNQGIKATDVTGGLSGVQAVPDLSANLEINSSALKQYQRDAQAAYEASLKLDESLNNILNSGVTSSLSSAFASLGTSIANGGNAMEAVGQSLLSSLGGVMVQLGELAIATGVGIKSIKLALKSLNPALAIGAGVALVALGSFFKAKASSIGDGVGGSSSSKQSNRIPGFASGVNNFSGGLALVGERGPELVNLPTGASVMNNNRTNQVLSQNKGNQNIQVFGEVGFDMDKFVIKLKNTENRLKRQGAL